MASLRRSRRSRAATKLKSFAFSSRAARLRGESPAQDSPRSREAAKSAKSAKISRRKILSCQQRIFGLLVQMNKIFICVHLWFRFYDTWIFSHSVNSRVQLEVRVSFWRGMRANDGQMTSRYGVRRLVAAFLLTPGP